MMQWMQMPVETIRMKNWINWKRKNREKRVPEEGKRKSVTWLYAALAVLIIILLIIGDSTEKQMRDLGLDKSSN